MKAWLVAMVALCGFAGPARAEEAVWSVAGKEVFRLRATVNGMTPEKRVEVLDERLNNILSKLSGRLDAGDIDIHTTEHGVVTIAVKSDLLVTVSKEDAAANHCSREALARLWRANLRKTVPLLAPRVNSRGA